MCCVVISRVFALCVGRERERKKERERERERERKREKEKVETEEMYLCSLCVMVHDLHDD